MRFFPFAAAFVSLVLAGVAVWQVVASSGEVDDVGRYRPTSTPAGESIEVNVEVGMSPKDIGNALEDAGVIESATQFNILTALLGYQGVLQAGDYEFQPGTPALTALYRIHRGQTSSRSVTIIEGWRLEQVADAVAEQGMDRDEFLAEAFVRGFRTTDGFEFLRDANRGDTLEGYLYPATYGIRKDETPHSLIEKMLTAFGDKVTPDIQDAAAAAGLNTQQIVTLASIIEREAALPEERPIMAQVFLSRLRQGIPLEADPTVQYALAEDPASVTRFGYWKEGLTRADLETESPYNTYANRGLPPGPICNPRLDSIEAVVHPATTNYLYFVARGDGSHAFASTLEEHLANVKKYQQP